MNNKPFRVIDRIKSFSYAMEGLKVFFKTEHNVWIHSVASVVVVVLGFLLHVNSNEWCWLIIAIALVMITEMINTAIEFLCDLVTKEIHPDVKKIKDISAGAVLISAMGAVIIGLIIFVPKL